MHLLQPIQPKLAHSALLWGALMLFLSFHDHFGGTPVIRGVLAAPMDRNIPPGQSEFPPEYANTGTWSDWQLPENPPAQPPYPVHPNPYAHPYSGTQPAQLVHPNQPVTINLYLNRKDKSNKFRHSLKKKVLATEKLAWQAGNYFSVSLPPTESSSRSRVNSVKYGPGLGETESLPESGMIIGTLTYVPNSPESTLESALKEFIQEIQDETAETNLIYLDNTLSAAGRKFEVVLYRGVGWYQVLEAMLVQKGTGAGAKIPENNVELQQKYSEMLEAIRQ
ncbi:hypothetical protein EV361DRAFT_947494 [Lentinula raphanica]|nr:hypothetical protein EV361DRAFT_947494 [Lentinula raphanica]